MTTSRWDRFVPLTGVVGVALAGAAFLKWGHQPDYFDRKPAIAGYFNKHHDDIVLATYLDMLAGFFLLWFMAVLRGRLRAHEGEGGRWSELALAGGAAAVAVTWVADALIYAGAERAAQPGPITPASAATLYDTSTTLMQPAAIGFGVALAATAFVAIRFHALPRWLAWSAAPLAVALLTPVYAVAMTITLAWVLATSVVLAVAEATVVEVVTAEVVADHNGAASPVVYRTSSTTLPVARR
ncbi:MAG TPA: hypothetical protein VGJ32_04355 [Solirubrobacteraceae bacterium]|jgi:hypothetical protein